MLEIVNALLVTVSLSGEIKTTVYRAPDWKSCMASVRAFTREPLPASLRDAHITCVRSPVNPLRGARAA